MPTTPSRTVRLGPIEVSIAIDRDLAERLKGLPVLGRLASTRPLLHNGLPDLQGVNIGDIDWYHTIDLPGGVVTPGFMDHRAQVPLYGLPDSLRGKRCLDAATCDGFWAFEMERRGAAEVVGIDLLSLSDCDVPANWRKEILEHRADELKGLGFAYAKRALQSKVVRRTLSIYDLSPERIGTFDFVFMSDVLLHLKEPLRALEALRSVTRGEGVVAEMYDPDLEPAGFPLSARLIMSAERPDDYSGYYWWSLSPTVLECMLKLAGFTKVETAATFKVDTRKGYQFPKIAFRVATS